MSTADQRRFLVFGAGAVGSLVGGRLRAGGAQVSLLGRDPHIAAIRQSGMRITDSSGVWGQHLVTDFAGLYTSPDQAPRAAFDVILLTTRTNDTTAAAHQALPLLDPQTGVLLSIQNGLGNWEAIASVAGWDKVVAGILNTGVEVAEPGLVNVTVQGFPLMIGRPPHLGAPAADAVAALFDAFATRGLPVHSPPDIRAIQWRKFLYNCALNAPAALREGKYSVLLDDPAARADQEAILAEGYAVAGALGIAISPPTLGEYRHWFFDDVFPRTADHFPSMLAHWRAGRRGEIDSLNGALVALGRQAGVPTPVNARVVEAILAREQQLFPTPSGS